MRRTDLSAAVVIVFLLVVAIGAALMLFGWPLYTVWQREVAGRAELAEAEWTKRIAVEEAKAKHESAKELAFAEIERAKGVAEANRIIGSSLEGNESYLRYLWIQSLQDPSNSVIYVPTEANLPILEAGRLNESIK